MSDTEPQRPTIIAIHQPDRTGLLLGLGWITAAFILTTALLVLGGILFGAAPAALFGSLNQL